MRPHTPPYARSPPPPTPQTHRPTPTPLVQTTGTIPVHRRLRVDDCVTHVRLIALGHQRPDRGTTLRRHREGTGYQPQAPNSPNHFTVREAVTYTRRLRGVPRDRRAEAIRRVAEDLNVADTRPRSLSGGATADQ